MTRQRRIILEELRKLKCHPSADQLFRIVRRHMPNISLGTVYRNLDVLVNGGLALKLDLAGGQSRYDGDVSPHFHIRCRDCGKVDDIPAEDVGGIGVPTVLRTAYAVTGWKMEFEGVCPACQSLPEAAGRIDSDRESGGSFFARHAVPQPEMET